MNESLVLATGRMKPWDRGRRCAIWVSPWIDGTAILDTSALQEDEWLHAGRDTFPPDCLLVVVSPAENARLLEAAATLPYPTSGPAIAASFIDARCRDNPELRARLRW